MSSMSTSSTMALMSPISQPRVAKVAGISVGAEGGNRTRVESQYYFNDVVIISVTAVIINSIYYHGIVQPTFHC